MMYEVTMQKNLMLNDQQAGHIVGQVLMKDFEFVCQSINALKQKRDLKPHEGEDLIHDLQIRDAMTTLIKYYLTYKEYTEFFELQRVYGNV